MFDREQRIENRENREQKEDPRMRERQGVMHFLISDIPHYNQLRLLIVQFCYTSNYQEWQRVGFGPGFSIPGLDPRVLAYGPNPARLLTGFFSRGPVKPCQIWAKSAAQPKKKKELNGHCPFLCAFFSFQYIKYKLWR